MNKPGQSFFQSFIPALKGIWFAIRTERNMRIHLTAGIAVIALGFSFNISRTEWLWLTSAMFAVWVTELLNTAIEQLTNLASPEWNPLAGKAKDLAAGAVLMAAIYAVLTGIGVFFPYFFS